MAAFQESEESQETKLELSDDGVLAVKHAADKDVINYHVVRFLVQVTHTNYGISV